MFIKKTIRILALLIFGCCLFQSAMASDSRFNFIFEENFSVLDTFQGTYTLNKWECRPAPVSIKLLLSKEELDRIYQKMVEIDFYNYPDNFTYVLPRNLPPSGDHPAFIGTTPGSHFHFKVKSQNAIKELTWNNQITAPNDQKVEKLNGLISLIVGIIESRDEVKKLPAPTCYRI